MSVFLVGPHQERAIFLNRSIIRTILVIFGLIRRLVARRVVACLDIARTNCMRRTSCALDMYLTFSPWPLLDVILFISLIQKFQGRDGHIKG